jgi:hypothetical protein
MERLSSSNDTVWTKFNVFITHEWTPLLDRFPFMKDQICVQAAKPSKRVSDRDGTFRPVSISNRSRRQAYKAQGRQEKGGNLIYQDRQDFLWRTTEEMSFLKTFR